ncbi:MAG: DUF1501 domain-containing protein [Pirellulales bacterium]
MKNRKGCNSSEHRFSRRQMFCYGGGAFAGIGLSALTYPMVAAELAKKEKQAILIWLDGGMSQLESWDPKPNTQFGGPYRAIETSVPGIYVSELLEKTAMQMHHLSVLRSVHTQDNSHSAGVLRINRGDPDDRGATYPYLGSAVAKLLGSTSSGLPPYVWVKPGSGGFKSHDSGFLGPKYGALALGDGKPPTNLLLNKSVNEKENEERNKLRQRFNLRYSKDRQRNNSEANSYVFDMADKLMNERDIFDESKISERDKDRYGSHDLGRHMLVGRQMLEAGVRFVKVNSYGWDSHGDHFNASDSLIRKFDQPFAALIEDLHDRSMLDNVLVIVMSEFGRTPKINSHVGRDHWPEAWSIAMAGSGLRSGTVVGKTNKNGTAVEGDEYDIGDLFHTWFRALQVPENMMEYDNNGQPLPVAKESCSAIKELLS